MTENEARERWVNELIRHEKLCMDDAINFYEDVHDSRGPVIDAVNRYAAILALGLIEKHGPERAAEIARLSVGIYEATEPQS